MRLSRNTWRRALTRLIYRISGVDVEKYRKQVDSLWKLSPEERERQLSEYLSRNRPLASDRTVITTMPELKHAPKLSKSALRERPCRSRRNHRLYRRRTAGTTGEPTEIALTKAELGRMLGVRDYCFRHYDVKLGDREARFWGRPEKGVKTRLKNFLLNRKVFHPLGESAVAQLKEMLSYRPIYIYGYSSLILEAAHIIKKEGLRVSNIRCVICTAETILPTQKRFIAEQFNAPVAEEYGSTEFDVIAFECQKGHRHLVNPWLVVENENDTAIISDISRETQHLLRYDTGDSLDCTNTSCLRLGSMSSIASLNGRSIDRFAYVSNQHKFHAVEFAKAMESFNITNGHNLDFQVKQRANNDFLLSVTGSGLINKETLHAYVEEKIRNSTGYSIELKVIVVPDNSYFHGSKRSYFVPEASEHV